MKKTLNSRRRFIKTTALAGGAPFILPSGASSAIETKSSQRVAMGFIGTGKQNHSLLKRFIAEPGVRAVAVCDVDRTRRENAKKEVEKLHSETKRTGWKGCTAYGDFRELVARDDIDAVCIATPDHWHTIQILAALEAGKDVYCEKPLTHNIHESIAVMDAVPRLKRVLQTGSMQRSMREFRVACELVRNGHVGTVMNVLVGFGPPGIPCDLPKEETEPGLDWDSWLGPAPMRPYNSILSPRGVHTHFPRWRNYREYGGGMVTDWGAHHLDITQWGLGADDSGPTQVTPPKNWKTAKYGGSLLYGNGVFVRHGNGNGVRFYGSKGEVFVTRGKFEFKLRGKTIARRMDKDDKEPLSAVLDRIDSEFIGANPDVRLYRSRNHYRDFLDAMQARKKPIAHEGIGARTAIACHLLNCGYYYGERIAWDPAVNEFARGTGDPAWLTREYRGEWNVA